jgi:hypothetical protein
VGTLVSWGQRCHGLRDDGDVGPRTAQVNNVAGTGTTWGAHRHRLREDNVVVCSRMASRA